MSALPALDLALAQHLADIALQNVAQEYPNKLDHVMQGEADVQSPRALHPVFYGSLDWHSCVHMFWSMARLLRLQPQLAQAGQITAWFEAHLRPEKIGAECAYLQQPLRQSFERTYGWAWLLKLQVEFDLLAAQLPAARAWRDALQPLTHAFVERYLHFLPLAHFPIRAGTHANSAFGLLFALEYAQHAQHPALRRLIHEKAHAWFGRDYAYPARMEPSSDDFLSGGLMEAVLMHKVVPDCDFVDWWQQFSPPQQELGHWLSPVGVSDRSDPKLAHLDGLNLSRAWCWRVLLPALPSELQPVAQQALQAHLQASQAHALAGDYAGTHWLGSFVLLALTEGAA
ncbi:DUF2891 domain-containing protein [Massilia sp. W12]|uniref:DUF2891 domain-containing protein n=1 Tax=Massilia sp. W12 TaxID=3126507 RepID=UPI0030CDAE3E